MKTLLYFALAIACQAQVININTGTTYPSIPSVYTSQGAIINGYQTLPAERHYVDGFRPIAEVPHCDDGTPINEAWQEIDGVMVYTWDCWTTEQAESARGAELQPLIGEKVATLVQLLAVFGLVMPLDFDEAAAAMYAQSKADNSKTPDGTLCMAIYNGLKEAGYTDRDIYLCALHQQGVAE